MESLTDNIFSEKTDVVRMIYPMKGNFYSKHLDFMPGASSMNCFIF